MQIWLKAKLTIKFLAFTVYSLQTIDNFCWHIQQKSNHWKTKNIKSSGHDTAMPLYRYPRTRKSICNVVFWHAGARGPIEWPCCILTARSFVFLFFDDFFFGKCTRKNCQSFGVNKQGNEKLERGFCLQSNFALQSNFLRWPWVIELYNDYVTHTSRLSFSFSFQRCQIYTDLSHTICVC